MLTAGAARASIEPPLPHDLQGFVRRPVSATGHTPGDPLSITGAVFEDDGRGVVVLAADLAGVDTEAADRIRNAVADALPVGADDVLINCSHSHAAPWLRSDEAKLGGGHDHYTPVERAYAHRLPYDFASVALEAWNARVPARAAGGTGRVSDLAVNRRERTADGRTILGWNRDQTIDEDMPTIRVDALDGTPISTITAFGCHPVVVGPDVPWTGTDFVGPLRRRVELLRGGVCVFLQGAAGNVLPLEAFNDHDGPQRPMGERMGLEAAHSIADADPIEREVVRLDFGSVTPIALYRRIAAADQPAQWLGATRRLVDLPMLSAPSLAELERELTERESELAALRDAGAGREQTNPVRYHVSWLRRMLDRGDALSGWQTSRGEVWAMRVGDCAIVGAPGEIFSEIGREVRTRSPFATTLFAGYCQGILGYVATPEEHPFGGYEPAVAQRGYDHPAPFAPEAASMLVDSALDALAELMG
jgi:neutral ceramidase